MPTASGEVHVERVRLPGPPPTFTLIVTIQGTRLGEGNTTFDPCPEEWGEFFTSIVGKRAVVTYDIGPPLVISSVKA